jgi:transcriptional regulator with XRE-family HTH domain
MTITAEQLRAARAYLDFEQKTLAEKAGLSVETIKRLERQNGPLQASFDTIRRLKEALELAGIEVDDGGKGRGPGIRAIVDRAAVLIDQINHHLGIARDAAIELDELVATDRQLLASVPKNIKSVAMNLILDYWRTGSQPRRRSRLKGLA